MSERLSSKLNLVRVVLVFVVVFTHSLSIEVYTNIELHDFFGNEFLTNLGYIFTKGYYNSAFSIVPVYMMISGFLFFRTYDGTLACYKRKIANRFKTVMVPFLIFNILFVLIILLQSYITNTNLASLGDIVVEKNLFSILKQLLWDTFPPVYPLWFIRNLFYLFTLSPIIYFLLKHTKIYGLIIVTILILVFKNIMMFRADDLLGFLFGAYVAIVKSNVLEKQFKKLTIFILVSLSLITISIEVYLDVVKNIQINIFHVFMIYIGALTIWAFIDLFGKRLTENIMKIRKYSFFIYLTHEPTMFFIGYLMLKIIPVNEHYHILISFLDFVIVFTLCLLVGMFLEKYFTRFFKLISGRGYTRRII